MSQQFDDKDYGEYFSAIEKDIERKAQASQIQKEKAPPKKLFGSVLRLRPWVVAVAVLMVAVLILIIALPKKAEQTPQDTESVNDTVSDAPTQEQEPDNFELFSDSTAQIESDIVSQCVIVVNCDTNQVVAAKNATERCYPASTTKIMTILTAVDYITDYNDTFTFSYEITDPFYRQDATLAGFADGEAVNMTDMLYGAILPSGADATAGLAIKIAGSEENFVKLMNQKAKQLGLRDTHFTNASGLFDKDHYTTPEDMAVIVRAAMQNQLCKKVLSTYQHTTAVTQQNPDGILLTSTLFSYMYGTEPEGADIIGGKTGYVGESGYCIASFGKSDSGTEYVCVTLKGQSLWPTVYDQINLYSRYAK